MLIISRSSDFDSDVFHAQNPQSVVCSEICIVPTLLGCECAPDPSHDHDQVNVWAEATGEKARAKKDADGLVKALDEFMDELDVFRNVKNVNV
ncbi:hypothetical protein CASFOL_008728 [Castilleja foliolosa]|uniref:Uncharacterized protein n=1 Tax=Castilleja foliolosa TaxID=1961234 RepID=A0ABD3DZT3_9LAMI